MNDNIDSSQVNRGFEIEEEEIQRDNNPRKSVKFEMDHVNEHKLLYSVDDVPPWYWSLLLGFQQYLTMFGGAISTPFIIAPALCMEDDDPGKGTIISTVFFVSGIVTLLQSTFGVRLPIIQGGSFSIVASTFAILSLPIWKCPAPELMANMTSQMKTELWQVRMREIQGAIIVSSLFEVALGLFGVVGIVLRFITPLTIAPAIAMVGLSLFKAAGNMAGTQWGISSLTIILIFLFSQYLRNVKCLCPYRRRQGWSTQRLDIFVLLPVLFTIIIMWTLCAVLTALNAFEVGSPARTDAKLSILLDAPWFQFPYPGQWGLPTVSLASVFGMLAGVMASTIESVGDYYACAKLSGARPPPVHAINRGFFIEGIGSVIAGLFGTANGTTSFSENVGAIGITKVGSRRVIQAAALVMMILGVFAKFGALFVTIPVPVIGGILCVMSGMITSTGLSNLHYVDLNSPRNLVVVGFSIFFSLVLSEWMSANPDAIQSKSPGVNQILTILFSTSMLVAGTLGFLLDNTIPGTAEERGLTKWLSSSPQLVDPHDETSRNTAQPENVTYDLPFITPWLRKKSWSKYIPISPTYEPQRMRSCRRKKPQPEDNPATTN